MTLLKTSWAPIGAALVLAACGGNQNPTLGRGDLVQNPPPRTASRSAADHSADLQSGGSSG